ncbi:MAG: LacI family DNA-binding transcriptional regulator [Nocardioidaceae bacterium]
MATHRQVNMADVARAAGVSIATVSRALRDAPGVSEPTRLRIKRLAEDLAYVVSPEASRLARGSTGRVGVVVPALNRWFYSNMLAGIEAELRDAEMDMLVYHVEGAADRSRFFERLPARRKVDAVVIVALPLTEQEMRRLDLMGVSVVVAGGSEGHYPHVRIDDAEAARQAVEHLVRIGHRRIGMIRTADPEGSIWPVDEARSQGYLSTLRECGIDFDDELMVVVPWGIDGGARAMDRLLSMRHPPSAVLAHSDEVAVGALRSLRRAGIRVPEGMSVVSIDDHPMAELTDLTTVHQPVVEQGAAAGRLVLDLLHGVQPAEEQVVLPTHLVIRSSTATAAGS